MTQLIAGLIGVVLGAVVSEGLRARNDARRQRRALIGAIRLVSDELLNARSAMETNAAANYLRRRVEDGTLSNATWAEYRPLLAEHLTKDDWTAVADPYFTIQLLIGNSNLAAEEVKKLTGHLPKEAEEARVVLANLDASPRAPWRRFL